MPRRVPWIFTRPALAACSISARSLRTCSALARTRYPATSHEVLAAGLEGLQPPVPVAVPLVVQASTGGVSALRPHLIHQPLRGSLRLQLPDRQRIQRCCVDGLTVEHQWIARLVSVVRNDETLTHRCRRVRSNLQPYLGSAIWARLGHAPWGQSLKSQSGRQDSNLRPSAPKAPALPSCATPRRWDCSGRERG